MAGLEAFANGLAPETFAARLHAACVAGDASAVKACIAVAQPAKSNVQQSVDAADIDLYTPLHRAVEQGSVEVVGILLDAGANPDVSHPGLDGWTPLHIACWKKNVPMAELLLEWGVNADALDWYGSRAEDLGDAAVKDAVTSWRKKQSGSGSDEKDPWALLNAKCQMVPSDYQAKMIEFSISHCKENSIGGEWVPEMAK
uniref:Uncharacterized protein n=1 Tax=Oxyrrhis marina TaxID=2969 RepID=A0A6U9K0P8_OXYMA